MRLFVPDALQRDAEIVLPAAAARHVQVRRLQPGDGLCLFDGRGGEWTATVRRMGRGEVAVRIGEFDPVEREPARRVSIALGMPANERMDFLVEKATELGVARILPLQCERSVLRLAGERAQRRHAHWQGIAIAAAEQCGRTRVPQVAAVQTLAEFLAQPPDAAQRLLLSPQPDAAALHAVAGGTQPLLSLSGPEGGLTPAEEAAALAGGFVRARLGERVLRADTAPLAVLAWATLAA
ncbi:MAG TPA: 16S rRNA (uracil(1498)-N(3))-methyltransferase [Rubrivivax sp.]|nr:16S rRNA (uracil(1498)-N(3))-methyltransferase [Rubrivivax sp.]